MPTLTIEGTVQFPLAAEANLSSRPFTASLVYTERHVDDLVLAPATSDQDILAPISDAKACYIEMVSGDATLKVNGAATAIPLTSTSGFWIYFNPAGGLTGLLVSSTPGGTMRLYTFS